MSQFIGKKTRAQKREVICLRLPHWYEAQDPTGWNLPCLTAVSAFTLQPHGLYPTVPCLVMGSYIPLAKPWGLIPLNGSSPAPSRLYWRKPAEESRPLREPMSATLVWGAPLPGQDTGAVRNRIRATLLHICVGRVSPGQK